MTRKLKPLGTSPNTLKAAIIRTHGTISAFAAAKGFRRATVYAALKGRRNGAISLRIRKEAA